MKIYIFIIIALSIIVTDLLAVPTNSSYKRNKEFLVPSTLKGRVDFWVDIFAKHGKYQVVMHHRAFPQAIYSVLDMAREGEVLSPIAFDNYKKKMVATETKAIADAIRKLANGITPKTRLEIQVQKALQKVSGGSSKYKKALETDMIRSQTGIKERYAEALKRSGRYMHIIEKVFIEEYGLPRELTKLPFIESSFDYTAYSSVGAAGIWQFMPRTGRAYGMQVGTVIDERRDVLKATKGAARYLSEAYQELGNWPLALTSYNHGVAGVKKKVRQAGTRNIVELIENPDLQAFGFASGNFWPEFLAALDIYDNYQKYFPGLMKDSPRYYTTYTMPQSASVGYVSRKLGISVEKLQDYNYALSPAVWKGRYLIPKGYQLRLPDKASYNTAALRAPEQKVESSTVYGGVSYRVRPGDTLGKISKKYEVSVASIKALNNLRSDMLKVGQLLVLKKATSSPNRVVSSNSVSTTAKPAPTTIKAQSAGRKHTVRKGESLWSIGKKYNVNVDSIKRLNNLRGGAIKAGQVLSIP
jgi:membrane-bound lytic murein transglycosylase D